jgi:hypothetical protein
VGNKRHRRQDFRVGLPVLALGVLGAWFGTVQPVPAAGLTCQQDCEGGGCAQVSCGPAVSGNGFCGCSTAALTWGEGTYSTWCRAWGRPQPACPFPAPAQDQYSDSMAPGAVSPRTLHGVVTEGGLHGSVQVVAEDGRSETIQW